MVEISEQGIFYDSATKCDDYVIFSFSDGQDICLPYSDVRVIDCNIFDIPELEVDPETGKWTINKVIYDIYDDTGKSLNDAYPICVYYDSNSVCIAMSNGEIVRIPNRPESCLISFEILAKDNPRLNKDIILEREGSGITGIRPEILNKWTLCLAPRFEIEGVRMTVNGEPQESGKTWQDFSFPVVYDVEKKDGTHVQFTVTLRSPHDFPTIHLFTDAPGSISKSSYSTGRIRIEDPTHRYGDVEVFDVPMKIKGRGNSTWSFFPKKPYHIKLDEKASIFGLPKNRDWIIMANYNDKSLVRNRTAMLMSRICGFSWTPNMMPVEVYMNGTYWGLYDFADHKEVAKHRVDIELVQPTDNSGDAVTGGYYLELECYPDEANSFWTDMQVPLTFKDPEYPTQQQKDYLIGWFKEFETALQSDYFADPNKGYAKYIDLKSFIDNYIIQELTKNYDGNLHKSTFFTKERNGKLEFYHIWDFDLSMGNCNFFSNYGISGGPTAFFVKDYGFQGYGYGWYYRLFQDSIFRTKVKNRWNQLKPQLKAVPDSVRSMAAGLSPAQERNFVKWDILNTNVWSQRRVPGSYQGEIDYLIEFYEERLAWLDEEINKW